MDTTHLKTKRRANPGLSRTFYLGPPVVPFLTPFLGEGSPTKMDYRKNGTLILTSLLEDLAIRGASLGHPHEFPGSTLGMEPLAT